MTTNRSGLGVRRLPELFAELADARTPAYLEAAIERASSRPQRPAWTHPGRWLPMDIPVRSVPTAPLPWRQLGAFVLIIILLAATLAVYVGSLQRRLPEPFGPAGNGVIALERAGDILVADRPGGALRPLVAGPDVDRSPMFSPDGTRLAFTRETSLGTFLMIADADGTNVVQIAPEPVATLQFAPDGRSIVGVVQMGLEKRVVVRPVDPAAAPTVLDIRLGGWSEISTSGGPTFRPTNAQELLVVGHLEPDGPQGIYVYDLATGRIRTVLEQPADVWVNDVAWLPDGEHITYNDRIVAADGSGDRALDALRMDQLSPFSNDGTRIVVDVEVVDVPGDDSHQRSVVVPIDGGGERVELACGLGMPIECARSWVWSPDDSMLIGSAPRSTPSDPETSLPDIYLQADPATGRVTTLDWVDVGTPAWQRVAP